MNLKEEARDLHYKLIEGYHLSNSPTDNAEIRALIVDVITNRFNAAIDEAVKVANDADKSTHPADLADKIKELKQ